MVQKDIMVLPSSIQTQMVSLVLLIIWWQCSKTNLTKEEMCDCGGGNGMRKIAATHLVLFIIKEGRR